MLLFYYLPKVHKDPPKRTSRQTNNSCNRVPDKWTLAIYRFTSAEACDKAGLIFYKHF